METQNNDIKHATYEGQDISRQEESPDNKLAFGAGLFDTKDQCLVNLTSRTNQLLKITAIPVERLGEDIRTFFVKNILLDIVSRRPIKPLHVNRQDYYKAFKFRLRDGKYIQLLSTRDGCTVKMEFKLIQIEKGEYITYNLTSFSCVFADVKDIFDFS